MSTRSYYESLLPAGFREGMANSAPHRSKCSQHGLVDLVDANGVITDGPDGTCPHCLEEEHDGLHFDCPEHGRITKDAATGKCPKCAAIGDPEGVEASARYYAPQEKLDAADIWPASIFAKPGERDGVPGTESGGIVGGSDLLAPQGGPAGVDHAGGDRAGIGGAGSVPDDVVRADTSLDLTDETLRERIASLRSAVAEGEASPEDCVMLGRYMKLAKSRGL